MIEGIFQSVNYEASKAFMDVAGERHKVLAGNLANSETPGFQRIDVDPSFESALQARFIDGDLHHFNPAEIEFSAERGLRPNGADGNNVSAERELQLINENALRYEMFGQFVSSSLRQLRTAITGRNS